MEFIANKYFVTNLLQAKKKETNITVYTAKHKVTTNSNIMKKKISKITYPSLPQYLTIDTHNE